MRSNAKKAKKSNTKRRSVQRPRTRRTAKSQPRVRRSEPGRFARYFLPGLVSAAIIGCLGVMALLGYRTVTASDFFDVRSIDVAGTARTSAEDVRKIVAVQTERSGVWNADLPDIRSKIEKLPFVRTAAVSRVLPNGIKVVVAERDPIAIVRLSGGDLMIDADGTILAPPKAADSSLIVVNGWDEAKTERAANENQLRVKLFRKMAADWNELGLIRRVHEVDLADLREPKAVVADSDFRIPVTLRKDELAKSLRSAIEAIAGKGERVRSVDSSGVYPVIEYAER